MSNDLKISVDGETKRVEVTGLLNGKEHKEVVDVPISKRSVNIKAEDLTVDASTGANLADLMNAMMAPIVPIYVMCKDDCYVDRFPDRRAIEDKDHKFKCDVCGKSFTIDDEIKGKELEARMGGCNG